MTDNLGGKAVKLVALALGGRGHARLSILGGIDYGEIITEVIMSWGRKQGQQLDNARGRTRLGAPGGLRGETA